jgi:hypothetical protein
MGYQLVGTQQSSSNAPLVYEYQILFDFSSLPGFSSAWAADPNHEPYTYTLQYAVDSGTDDENEPNNGWPGGWQDTPPSAYTSNFAPTQGINDHMNNNAKFTSPVNNGYSSPFILGGANQLITLNSINVTEGQGAQIFGFRIKLECQAGHAPEFSNVVNITLPDSQ